MFVAREFLPVVLDDEKEKTSNRVSTEKKFKALRTHSLNVKYVHSCVTLVVLLNPRSDRTTLSPPFTSSPIFGRIIWWRIKTIGSSWPVAASTPSPSSPSRRLTLMTYHEEGVNLFFAFLCLKTNWQFSWNHTQLPLFMRKQNIRLVIRGLKVVRGFV